MTEQNPEFGNDYAPPELESDKTLLLIAEYSEKLRIACRDYLKMREDKRSSIYFGMTAFSVLLFTSLFVYFSEATGLSEGGRTVISFGVAVLGILFFVGTIYDVMKPTDVIYDATRIAEITERLTLVASQYREHSDVFIADQFEFDLRLADAAASLKMFHEVFGEVRFDRFNP